MSSWTRSTTVTIDCKALRHNFRQIVARLHPDQNILSVVKSNAYGHGGPQVARILVEEGCSFLGVGTIDEGRALREAGVRVPILVLLGDIGGGYQELLHHQLIPVIQDFDTFCKFENWLNQNNKKSSFHLKVDTGMTRLGFLPDELLSKASVLSRSSVLKIQGVMSHLIDATDVERTGSQQEAFDHCLQILRKNGVQPQFIHLANSVATIEDRFSQYNMVRPGIVLYGVLPHPRLQEFVSLKPIMTWKTKVINVKEVPAGTVVSYNATFKTRRPSRIAVLPVGYADGYPRRLSNRAHVLIRGRKAPVVGIVCMDLTMVDVTEIGSVSIGDEVVLLGGQGSETLLAEEMAQWADTIPYEILTGVALRVPRIYQDEVH
ncbi:MAG: alanine racemase [Deltaproteobacteria bacterium RIFCSPLOWO2_02_FULL_50_16]|nr:MAG: alanine racemase [Deltaproteobacteria bacterium GWA2_50_8]OGQ26627.1 MAG: alanine racemase [Deltaproteobacteria bacterium RIFCSPHIGHO2_02_FULL_50_15]OGQ57743.1 MAG: alanine racemase [Deltaproteobacteria bacterium RIFCSPLOWO2_02_FULL_50_16]OGQ68796.1 MAG: alanine racemase [Deltaproteobacteria bacterium RIFCSPLOWO2_12_FULL_50_11]